MIEASNISMTAVELTADGTQEVGSFYIPLTVSDLVLTSPDSLAFISCQLVKPYPNRSTTLLTSLLLMLHGGH